MTGLYGLRRKRCGTDKNPAALSLTAKTSLRCLFSQIKTEQRRIRQSESHGHDTSICNYKIFIIFAKTNQLTLNNYGTRNEMPSEQVRLLDVCNLRKRGTARYLRCV